MDFRQCSFALKLMGWRMRSSASPPQPAGCLPPTSPCSCATEVDPCCGDHLARLAAPSPMMERFLRLRFGISNLNDRRRSAHRLTQWCELSSSLVLSSSTAIGLAFAKRGGPRYGGRQSGAGRLRPLRNGSAQGRRMDSASPAMPRRGARARQQAALSTRSRPARRLPSRRSPGSQPCGRRPGRISPARRRRRARSSSPSRRTKSSGARCHGVTRSIAEATTRKQCEGVLLPDFLLPFELGPVRLPGVTDRNGGRACSTAPQVQHEAVPSPGQPHAQSNCIC
jgi:hypothetical protein